ncbi:MAG: hypothetical protein AAF658_13130 [Myxococcota bacterium]
MPALYAIDCVVKSGAKPTLAIDTLAAPAAAAVACSMTVFAFKDGFANGATWSGINPGGGGPGFLLLVGAGGLSYLLRSKAHQSLSYVSSLSVSAIGAVLCALAFLGALKYFALTDSDALRPLTSGVAGAFFVPRVVVATLQQMWDHGERAPPQATAEA